MTSLVVTREASWAAAGSLESNVVVFSQSTFMHILWPRSSTSVHVTLRKFSYVSVQGYIAACLLMLCFVEGELERIWLCKRQCLHSMKNFQAFRHDRWKACIAMWMDLTAQWWDKKQYELSNTIAPTSIKNPVQNHTDFTRTGYEYILFTNKRFNIIQMKIVAWLKWQVTIGGEWKQEKEYTWL